MVEGTNMETTTSLPSKEPIRKKMPFQSILDNPVILKELRGRMRSRQAVILLTVYLGLIALFTLLIYNVISAASSTSWDPSARQESGKAVFGTVILVELLLLCFLAPGLTAGAITAEKERQTYDLLRTTLISASSLVLGKLGSSLAYLLLLILTALPLQSIAFLIGGVGLGEMVVSSLILIVTAVFFCTLGIFFSSFMKRTLTATVSSYITILVSFLGLGAILFLIAFIQELSGPTNSIVATTRENIFALGLWFLVSTNPILTAILSEVILVDQQSLFITNRSMFGFGPTYLPSPWIPYIAIYTFLTLILILLSIRNVKRPER